ncbi:shikimate 5-dehydrogenase [Synechococcus sp. PCC 7335]|uniref:shikimate dehydrogenase n=1 Tax=Synechococcus sp. (strain ATCC 29403 / PCC 7335) TaxID=91464 RepID=UPI00017ED249|nr:shikimate dehydrogenase [Synechococcus sp. PCC 7335]EDX87036.1 shikimate 5-dehydrogenase [Synechococcus sp. PCC 7335]
MTIKGTTQLLGVIGYPIKHSFSPLMHNAAIAHLRETGPADYVYLPFPVHPENLKDAIIGFKAIGLRGFNITIPHKQTIIPLLDEVSEVAKAIGAVNTVWYGTWNKGDDSSQESGWCGTNTDAIGFLSPLQALKQDWTNTRAIVLGNGGASRAVVAACHQLGCKRISVVGRNLEKLAWFAESWANSPDIAARLKVMTWEELPDQLQRAGLVVNATPVGMHPNTDASVLSDDELALLPTGAIAYDLIYTPRPTKFLRQAAAAGLTTVDGLEMLVQQGAAALEIWLDRPAPIDIMRRSLLDHLAQA